MKIASCELRNAITIEEYIETQDSTGQPVKAWVLFAAARAKVDTTSEFGRSREMEVAGSLMPHSYVIFFLRYIAGLTEKMRIVLGGVYYDIIAIADIDGRHAFYQVRCVVGPNDG